MAVTEGLVSIEKSDSALSHIACLGYEYGEKVLWGTAQKKAKIWQQSNGSIDDWITWCDRVYQKLSDDVRRLRRGSTIRSILDAARRHTGSGPVLETRSAGSPEGLGLDRPEHDGMIA